MQKSTGITPDHLTVEDEGLPCAERSEALLSQSIPFSLPPPPCPVLPQPQLTLSFAWLSRLWGQKHSDGDSTRRQLQSVLLRVRREDRYYSFRKERERIQKLKKNYTNCLGESKVDIKLSPRLDLRERQREGLASLGLKEKLSRKLSGVPQWEWPQALPKQDSTDRSHCNWALLPGPWNLFCLFRNQQKSLASFKSSICFTKGDVTSWSATVPMRQPHHSMLKTGLSNTSNIYTDSVWQWGHTSQLFWLHWNSLYV